MNKTEQITFYKKQIKSAQTLIEVARQNMELAARFESEAKTALELLGARPERGRKVYNLSEDKKLSLIASLTNKKTRQ
ncbi:hypothetical protein [Flavobacterium kingsejongi]|uniref:Uncharacterized protein n=1 Tax=Flavobacterium kingsejongi TaxID=1678728 RepID=A0A2S1LQJ7_9FLAO|nr:hypothetical protein [Flavobacterium kingsejongi]AWG26030.1 hypothetical protein FK004_12740 [Flavobacterium kingsejongi]